MLDEQAANAKKRKREHDDGEEDDIGPVDGIALEEPLDRFSNEKQKNKKPKQPEQPETSSSADGLAGNAGAEETKTQNGPTTAEQDAAKASKMSAKAERQKAKSDKMAVKCKIEKEKKTAKNLQSLPAEQISLDIPDEQAQSAGYGDDIIDGLNIDTGLVDPATNASRSTVSPSPTAQSSTFDHSNIHSGSSSISSIVPPTGLTSDLRPDQPKDETNDKANQSARTDPEELKARLQKRIEALRVARKADAVDGSAPRSRQELLEQRRRKDDERKAHKKELRRKAKEDERRKHLETIARGSPLLSGSPLMSPGSPVTSPSAANNFSFGRINFAHGHKASSSLANIIDPSTKTKGPSDSRTALQAAQNHEARLAALDPSKRAEATEKEAWLHAKQRAEGTKIRDDSSLLKKTLKRKDKQKKKSEREWGERIAGVEKGKAARQQKRENNLMKRKEEKGSKKGNSSSGGGKGSKGQKVKRKARPGFEGSFRSKAPRAAGGGEMKPRRR